MELFTYGINQVSALALAVIKEFGGDASNPVVRAKQDGITFVLWHGLNIPAFVGGF